MATGLLPYTRLGALVGLTALPAPVLLRLLGILVLYGTTAEEVTNVYFRANGFLE